MDCLLQSLFEAGLKILTHADFLVVMAKEKINNNAEFHNEMVYGNWPN